MSIKNNTLKIRLSDAEKQHLESLANKAEISMAEVLRDHIGQVQIRNRKDERARVAMLNRINANLNMLARWVNTHKGSADSIEVIGYLMAIEREAKRLADEKS